MFASGHQLRQRAHPAAGGIPRPGAGARRAESGHGDGGTASIHDIEEGIRLDVRPPLDAEDRALVLERVLPRGVGLEEYARGAYWPVLSWARRRCEYAVARRKGGVEIDVPR